MTSGRKAAAYAGALLFFTGLGDPTGLISVPLLFLCGLVGLSYQALIQMILESASRRSRPV